ncbi:MAG TPA: putative sugar nucleotidyl transferase [Chitinophagaceae bacterium]|jgi:UDP-N-acetylglucosamine diphosphorylase/glucosamine-1-phosphate N-acetyltransferase|nr:putative sugar nucleotidyl transferase [Chitinophagaceae bacterium]
MKKIVFTEEFCSPEDLFPFTLTRQVQDIRIGIFTIREKWERYLGLPSFDQFEEDYKDRERSVVLDAETLGSDTVYLIHGNLLPTARLVQLVEQLAPGEFISIPEKESAVYCINAEQIQAPHRINMRTSRELDEELREIRFPWDIFQQNAWAIAEDFKWIAANGRSARLSDTNRVTGSEHIFLEEGAQVEHCIINASEGPVYIGKNALVMEGSLLRGPLSIGEGAVVKMGAKLYGATTIGPKCTVGGEIKNSILFGYSNKAHDGYLGDAVVGEWCNFGAGTSCSNVKNTASEVMVYTPSGPRSAGLKCGVIMGDYSRTAINTSLNTGTVIGPSANVFGNGLLPKYIPSFSWGADGLVRYEFDKACTDIGNWKRMKGGALTEGEINILKHIFDHY